MKTIAPLRLFRFPSAALCALVVTAIVPLSCVRLGAPSLPDDIPASAPDGTLVEVTVQSLDEPCTKSSWLGDPARVDSFVLMAYRNACLDAFVSSEDGAAVSVRLLKGQSYHLYALAHVPGFVPPRREADLAVLSIPAGDFGSADGLPMACRVPDFVPSADGQCLTLAFERLFARLVVRVEKGCLGLLRIGRVRLRQAASFLHPFAAADAGFSGPPDGGLPETLRESLSETALYQDGDYAGGEDLDRLNAGDSLVLYVPENRQGNLLPGNTSPWVRIPENLGDAASRCTFLEVAASLPDGQALEGDAVCRIFLGLDAAENFDVPRNADLRLSLFLTDKMLTAGLGWRIESRLRLTSGMLAGRVENGMHLLDNLYLGEVFSYAVEPSEEVLALLGGDLSRCSLRCVRREDASATDEDSASEAAPLAFTPLRREGNLWLSDGHCRSCCEDATIELCLDGTALADLNTAVAVHLPLLSIEGPPHCAINAAEAVSYALLLSDRDGNSLSGCYGFDADVFDFEAAVAELPGKAFSLRREPGSAGHPGGSCLLRLCNAGDDADVNRLLTRALGHPVLQLELRDRRLNLSASRHFSAAMLPVSVSVGEGGPDADWRIRMDNPSRIPLDWSWTEAAFLLDTRPGAPVPTDWLPARTLRVLSYSDGAFVPNLVYRGKSPMADTTDGTELITPSSSLSALAACRGMGIDCQAMGLEPSLHFPGAEDYPLSSVLNISTGAFPASLPLCLFSPSGEERTFVPSEGEQQPDRTFPDPKWLRYSAYDDVGWVRFRMRWNNLSDFPVCSCTADRGCPSFAFGVAGYFYGGLYVYPNGKIWGGDYRYDCAQDFFTFVQSPPGLPADGREYEASDGILSWALQKFYDKTVQDDNTVLGTNHYQHHPYIDRVEYQFTATDFAPQRIFEPEFEASFQLNWYHAQDNLWLAPSAVCVREPVHSLLLYE